MKGKIAANRQFAGIDQAAHSQVNVPIAYGANLDREGRFSFNVYDGLKILIQATVELEKGKYVYSDYVEASIMGEDVKVRIVVPGNR